MEIYDVSYMIRHFPWNYIHVVHVVHVVHVHVSGKYRHN